MTIMSKLKTLRELLARGKLFLKQPAIKIEVIHDGKRFRKLANLENVNLTGVVLHKIIYKETCKPRAAGTSKVVTVPAELPDIINGKGFQECFHLLEPDGRDTLIYRGTANGGEKEK